MTRELDNDTLLAVHACAFAALMASGPDPGASPTANCSGVLWDELFDIRDELEERGLLRPVSRLPTRKRRRRSP